MKYLLLVLIFCQVTHAAPNNDAINHFARALYYQQHWDELVSYNRKHYVDRDADYLKQNYVDPYINKKMIKYVIIVSQIMHIYQDHYISYTWRF